MFPPWWDSNIILSSPYKFPALGNVEVRVLFITDITEYMLADKNKTYEIIKPKGSLFVHLNI